MIAAATAAAHPMSILEAFLRESPIDDDILDLPLEILEELTERFDHAWTDSELRQSLDPRVNAAIERLFPGTIGEIGSPASLVRDAYDDPFTAAVWVGVVIPVLFWRGAATVATPRGDREPKSDTRIKLEDKLLAAIDRGFDVAGPPVERLLDAAEGPAKYVAGVSGSARDLLGFVGRSLWKRARHPPSPKEMAVAAWETVLGPFPSYSPG